jgi:WD40 repeat protein
MDELGPTLFAVHGKLLFSAKHWDGAFKVTHLESGRLVQSVALHHDVVTGLALCHDGPRSWLVTASSDCSVMVWEVGADHLLPVSPTPLHTLTGHDDPVACVAASPQLDMVVSASRGSVVVHSLFHGTYVRTLDMAQLDQIAAGAAGKAGAAGAAANSGAARGSPLPRIHWVVISHKGYILTYSRDDRSLCSFSANGKLMKRQAVGEQLHAFLLSEDGNVLLTGGQGRRVVWRWVHDLSLANDGARKGFEASVDGSGDQHKVPAFPAPIRSLAMSEHERQLMVGLENGQVYILAPDSNYLRQRLQKQLEYLGFY